MDPVFLGIVAMVAVLALIMYGVPIAFALGFVGVIGNGILIGWPQTALQTQLIAWEVGTNFLFIAAPLFLFMGQLVYHTGVASDMYEAIYKWFGRLPGGLAVTSTVASAGFGAVTGSSIAAVATMGTMVMPEMKKYNYDMGLATPAPDGSSSGACSQPVQHPRPSPEWCGPPRPRGGCATRDRPREPARLVSPCRPPSYGGRPADLRGDGTQVCARRGAYSRPSRAQTWPYTRSTQGRPHPHPPKTSQRLRERPVGPAKTTRPSPRRGCPTRRLGPFSKAAQRPSSQHACCPPDRQRREGCLQDAPLRR